MRELTLPAIRSTAYSVRVPLPLLLFIVAAGLRLASFLVFYIGSLATGHGGLVDMTDPIWYDRWAWYAAEHLRQGQLVNIRPYRLAGTYDIGFQYWVAAQYAIVGHFPEVPRLTNVLLAALVAPLVYLAARGTILGEEIAQRAGWLAAVWPLSIFWAGYDLLKDPLAWFLLAIVIVAICARSTRRFLVLGTTATAAMLLVRSYVGTGLLLILPLSAILKRSWPALIGVIALLAAVELVLIEAGQPAAWSVQPYTGNGQPYASQTTSAQPAQGSVGGIVGGAVGDRSGAGTAKAEGGTDATSVFRQPPKVVAERLVVGLAITVLGPRPAWKDIIHPTIYTGLYPGLLVWILLIPFAGLGLWRAVASRDSTMLALTVLGVGLWVGLSFAYAGVFRQREMAFPVTMIFIAWGLQRPWPRHWRLIYATFFGVGFVALVAREIYTHLT